MPHRPLGEHAVRRHLDGRRVELDQLLEIRTQRDMAHGFVFPPDDNDAIRDPSKRAGPTRRRRAALISLTGAENTRMLDQVAWPGKRAPDGASVHALGQALDEIAVEQNHHGDDGQRGEMRERPERPP